MQQLKNTNFSNQDIQKEAFVGNDSLTECQESIEYNKKSKAAKLEVAKEQKTTEPGRNNAHTNSEVVKAKNNLASKPQAKAATRPEMKASIVHDQLKKGQSSKELNQ